MVNAVQVPARAAVRAVANDLQAAEAAKIAKVVAMVDALPNRGVADELIAPLRSRLQIMRVPRPLRFPRLLFLPLDGVIVPPMTWRRGSPAIPRSVLNCIAGIVQALLGAKAREVEAMAIDGLSTDHARVVALGRTLWPEAGQLLMHAAPPTDWTSSTGLQTGDFAVIARNVAAVLLCGVEIETLDETGGPVTPESQQLVSRMLTEAALHRPAGLPTLIAALLAAWPDCALLLTLAERLSGQKEMGALRQATDGAIDFALSTIETAPGLPENMLLAEQDLKRAVSLIEACDGRPAQTSERGQRIRELRKRYEQEARTRFASSLETDVVRRIDVAAGTDSAAVAQAEAGARDLRRFEVTARRVGAREHYDRELRKAADQMRPTPADSPRARIDKIRVVEIIAGPETAMAMLKAV